MGRRPRKEQKNTPSQNKPESSKEKHQVKPSRRNVNPPQQPPPAPASSSVGESSQRPSHKVAKTKKLQQGQSSTPIPNNSSLMHREPSTMSDKNQGRDHQHPQGPNPLVPLLVEIRQVLNSTPIPHDSSSDTSVTDAGSLTMSDPGRRDRQPASTSRGVKRPQGPNPLVPLLKKVRQVLNSTPIPKNSSSDTSVDIMDGGPLDMDENHGTSYNPQPASASPHGGERRPQGSQSRRKPPKSRHDPDFGANKRDTNNLLQQVQQEETEFQYIIRQQQRQFQHNTKIMNHLTGLGSDLGQLRDEIKDSNALTRETLQDHENRFRVIQDEIREINQRILNGGQVPQPQPQQGQQAQRRRVSYACGIRGQRHRYPFELRIQTLNGIPLYFCPRCDKNFPSETGLKAHIVRNSPSCPCQCQRNEQDG